MTAIQVIFSISFFRLNVDDFGFICRLISVEDTVESCCFWPLVVLIPIPFLFL
jgi:hypothetical protein